MNIRSIIRCLWITLLAFASAAGRADDIDIYVGSDQISGAPANVLIVMDNTANFASVAEKVTDANGNIVTNAYAEATAMKLALAALPENALNVGVMLYGGPRDDSSTYGGYPIYAIRPVNGDFRPTLEALLTKVQVEADANKPEYKGPASASYADLMNSVFRYFNGLESFNDVDDNNSGDETELRDFEGNKFPYLPELPDAKQRMKLTDYFGYTDTNTEKYQQPKQAKDGCARNVVIFVGNSTPSADNNWDVLIERLKKAADGIGVSPTTTGIKEADALKLFAPYWTQFMNTYGVKSSVQDAAGQYIWNKITTYTVDVCNVGCRGDVDGDGVIEPSEESAVDQAQRRLLRSMAAEGGGKYYKATNIQELTDNFKAIFAEIQAVNSAFASATLPISVNTQGTFENQVYIGVFRPDPNFGPRWQGNLKGYKFGRYCDANENGAVDFDAEITNFIPKTLDNAHTPTATDERIGEGVVGYVCNSTVNTGTVLPVALYLADKYGYPAIDQKLNTGFFDQSSTSFWTKDTGSFWEFDAAATGNTKDIPDGPAVERGGAAQQVRLKWADPAADSRNIYTCLSCASGTDLNDPANAFKSATVVDVLNYGPIQRPTTASRTITGITRTGTTATATYTGNALSAGNEVEILGVTPSAYGGPVTLTAATATTFSYSVIETPLQNATASASGVLLVFDTPIKSSITLAGPTIVGNTVELTGSVTLSGAGKVGLVDTDTPKIEGATQPFLNRASAVISNVGGTTTFDYRNKIVLAPSAVSYATRASPTAGATAKAPTTAGGLAIDKAYYLVASQKVVMRLNTAIHNNGEYATGKTVRITGAGWPYTKYGASYSDWTIIDKGTACDANILASDKNNWFCFTLPTTGLYTSPDPASPNIDVSFTTLPNYAVTLTRAAGSDIVTATIPANRLPHTLTGLTSVKISGSQGVAGVDGYDGDWTIDAGTIVDGNDPTFSFTIGAGQPITARGPVSPATLSSATATPDTEGPSTSNLFIWQRGKDLLDENRDADKAGARASIHGDVLHSRPAVVNYGSPGLYAFYGSNDGYLRGVKVGPDEATDAERGRESWAFIPEEFLEYSKLSRLYMESPPVLYPNSACSVTDPPSLRHYYWDGPVAVYQSPTSVYYTTDIKTVSTTEAAALATGCVAAGTCYKRPEFTWLFAGMRRGGNTVYALDISNPAKPKFMWKVSPSVANFEKLGQTWSEPKFVLLKHKATAACLVAADGQATPELKTAAQKACTQTLALVFGGGYDAATDDLPSGTARPEASTGYGVYVVKASDGSFIKHLMPTGVTKRSVSADVTALDTNGDGYLDRIYAADTGAQLLRFDADTTKELADAAYWGSYLVAKLGDLDGTAGGTDDRKVMQQPAVVPYVRDGVKGYNVMVGTGNREKPIANKKPYSTLAETSRSKTGGSSTLGCTTATTGYYVATGYFGEQIADRFYSILDTEAAPGSAITCDSTCSALQEVNADPSTLKSFLFSSGKKGWFINLNYNPYQPTAYNGWEEKMVNSPKVEQGIVYFATNTPQKGETEKGICSNLGVALAYAIDPFTGLPAFNRNADTYDGKAVYTAVDYAAKVAGGGLPPSVTFGTVKIGEEFYRAAIGTGGTKETSKSSQEGERTDFQVSTRRSRVYWRYGAD